MFFKSSTFLLSICTFLLISCSTTNKLNSDTEAKLAKHQAQIEKHEQEIQSLYLRVDDLGISDEHQAYKDNQQLLTQLQALKVEVESIKSISNPSDEVQSLRKQVVILKQEVEQLKKIKTTSYTNKPKQNKKKTYQNTADSAEIELYQKARNLYVRKDFANASQLFREFLKKYASHKYAANSQYWLGECYYSLEDFQAALNEFQKVVDFYKESPKAPDAQIKIALTYKQVGEPEQAKIELRRVLKMYPNYERKQFVNSLLKEM